MDGLTHAVCKSSDLVLGVVFQLAVQSTIFCAVAGIAVIIIFLLLAWAIAKKVSRMVLETILEPLHAIEDVAKELTEGNLHSQLEYRQLHRRSCSGQPYFSFYQSMHLISLKFLLSCLMQGYTYLRYHRQPDLPYRP